MTRVAVFSYAAVVGAVSSPAIRARQLAQGLAREFDVTLVAPAPAPEGDAVRGVQIETLDSLDARDLTRTLRLFDVVVAQKLPIRTMRALANEPTYLVLDLYTPTLAESLVSLEAAQAGEVERRTAAVEVAWQELCLVYGDAFVCPGERQRDYWLGLLADVGRIDLEAYRADPSLRSLIAVVPFAVPDDPVPTAGGAIRGSHPRISVDDLVLLWSGGIVNWTDAETPIRALAQLPGDIKLFFLGFRPPDADPPVAAVRARDVAAGLGLLETRVFFADEWIPYDDRPPYLVDADVGIAGYKRTFESRLAYRARLLDYLWAGLPMITSSGDELADWVVARDLGRTVDPGDVDAWAAAISELTDASLRRQIAANAARAREALSLERCVAPLRAMVGSRRPVPSRSTARARLELRVATARAALRRAGRSRRG